MVRHSYKINKLIMHLSKDVNSVRLPASRREYLRIVSRKLERLLSDCKSLEFENMSTNEVYRSACFIFSEAYTYED